MLFFLIEKNERRNEKNTKVEEFFLMFELTVKMKRKKGLVKNGNFPQFFLLHLKEKLSSTS